MYCSRISRSNSFCFMQDSILFPSWPWGPSLDTGDNYLIRMRKIILSFLLISLSSIQGFSQPLSPSAKISLVICAPGDEIYSYFGHAAIRVNDPLYEKDIIINYGVFSFETPPFYLAFCQRGDRLPVGRSADEFIYARITMKTSVK